MIHYKEKGRKAFVGIKGFEENWAKEEIKGFEENWAR